MNQPPPRSSKWTSKQILAMMLGAVVGIVVVIGGTMAVMVSRAIPELSVEEFAAAEHRWTSVAPPDYSIETQVKGMQPATYRVEVRDGIVTSATRNGNPLRDQRTLGTWSVPGMFGTMESDVNTNQDAEPGQEPLQLRAEFHPDFGYPQRYVRLAWGTKVTTSWEVRSFNVGDPLRNKSAAP